ncbi:MAG: C_GCAxxG_C_C family protein [Oscillospiraceae bacterium]|nr:C_GCAxxG_C_C family protein [Oscillospiraceae bacterium]
MDINERAELAIYLKAHGYNCAQAVTAALAHDTELDADFLNKVSAGFCAGMGTMEATCGALIGAGMIAGARTEGAGTLRYTRRLLNSFKEKCGAVTCKDLKSLQEDGKPLCPCEDCVRNAVLAYGEIME